MIDYIVFWKDEAGQQVATTVDAHNRPVHRDHDYVITNDIPVLKTNDEVFNVLELANGDKFAITPHLARETLGWDV